MQGVPKGLIHKLVHGAALLGLSLLVPGARAAVQSHALANLGTPTGAAEVDQQMAGKQQEWRTAETRADGESNNSARCTAGRHQEKRHSQGHMRKQSTSKRPPSACPQKSRFDPDFGPLSGR